MSKLCYLCKTKISNENDKVYCEECLKKSQIQTNEKNDKPVNNKEIPKKLTNNTKKFQNNTEKSKNDTEEFQINDKINKIMQFIPIIGNYCNQSKNINMSIDEGSVFRENSINGLEKMTLAFDEGIKLGEEVWKKTKKDMTGNESIDKNICLNSMMKTLPSFLSQLGINIDLAEGENMSKMTTTISNMFDNIINKKNEEKSEKDDTKEDTTKDINEDTTENIKENTKENTKTKT